MKIRSRLIIDNFYRSARRDSGGYTSFNPIIKVISDLGGDKELVVDLLYPELIDRNSVDFLDYFHRFIRSDFFDRDMSIVLEKVFFNWVSLNSFLYKNQELFKKYYHHSVDSVVCAGVISNGKHLDFILTPGFLWCDSEDSCSFVMGEEEDFEISVYDKDFPDRLGMLKHMCHFSKNDTLRQFLTGS